jgi:hypothetical protein
MTPSKRMLEIQSSVIEETTAGNNTLEAPKEVTKGKATFRTVSPQARLSTQNISVLSSQHSNILSGGNSYNHPTMGESRRNLLVNSKKNQRISRLKTIDDENMKIFQNLT